jgi:hypothetical protein
MENKMSLNNRTLEELFEQLGLSPQKIHIERFIDRHQLKPGSVLSDAIFWTSDQKAFLIEAKEEDSEWSAVVDQLASMLIRQSNPL